MKPFHFYFLLLALSLIADPAKADPSPDHRPERETINVIVDLIILRPITLAATLAGTGLFVGFAPFTAMASIAPPHDAFARAANALIATPACHTFNRPLGHHVFYGQASSNQGSCAW